MKTTGREKFKRYKILINLSIKLISLLPSFVKVFLWDLVSRYSQVPFVAIRYIILQSLIKKCGDNVNIGKNVTIKNWKGLTLGNNISIHDNCYIDAAGEIIVGDNVSIAHNSILLSSTHTFNGKLTAIKYNPVIKSSLNIGNDVWIGCGVRILYGIEIASRTIIAAGAVLNKSTEMNSIYGGVPAKIIKRDI